MPGFFQRFARLVCMALRAVALLTLCSAASLQAQSAPQSPLQAPSQSSTGGAGQPAAASPGRSLREELFEAIEADNAETLLRLLKAGVHFNARNDEGETALYAAAEQGRLALVQLLLTHKADVMARTSNGETALHAAAIDRKSTRLNSSHTDISRMPSSA